VVVLTQTYHTNGGANFRPKMDYLNKLQKPFIEIISHMAFVRYPLILYNNNNNNMIDEILWSLSDQRQSSDTSFYIFIL